MVRDRQTDRQADRQRETERDREIEIIIIQSDLVIPDRTF